MKFWSILNLSYKHQLHESGIYDPETWATSHQKNEKSFEQYRMCVKFLTKWLNHAKYLDYTLQVQ